MRRQGLLGPRPSIDLITTIKRLELELGVTLVVVHVPGVVMIEQGTDGQSRGVWATALHARLPQATINAAVFAPVKFDYHWTQWMLRDPSPGTRVPAWRYQAWDSPWDARDLFD